MVAPARIIDRDFGFRALFPRLRRSERASLTVGIHEEEGAQTLEGGGELTVADVAAFHEFGTSRVPRRSWLLDGITENEGRIRELTRRLGRRVIANRDRLEPRRALDILGLEIVTILQRRIRDGIPPPLSPVTIARKGSSTALIDTGQLIASIRHKVTP